MNGNVAPTDMKNVTEEVLYLTASSLVREMTEIVNKSTSSNGELDPAAFGMFANVFNWIIDVGEKVRLDTAVTIIQDLTASCGNELRAAVLSEEFDTICPRFAAFAEKNYIVL